MPHKPVLEVGPFPAIGTPQLKPNRAGFAVHGNQRRIIAAIGKDDLPLVRVGLKLYEVDLSPYEATVSLPLRDRSGRYDFPLRLTLSYAVSDPKALLERQLSRGQSIDTQVEIERALDLELKRTSRQFYIFQGDELLDHLNARSLDGALTGVGVKAIHHEFSLRKDQPEYAAVLERIEVWSRPRTLEFLFSLDDRTGAQKIPIGVRVEYVASGPEKALELVESVADRLRQDLTRRFQEENRRHLIDQDALIEQRLGRLVEPDIFARLGLRLEGRPNVTVRRTDDSYLRQRRELEALLATRVEVIELSTADRTRTEYFPVKVRLVYRVTEPERYLGRGNIDLTAVLKRAIERALYEHSRKYSLNELEVFERELPAAILPGSIDVAGITVSELTFTVEHEDPEFKAAVGRWLARAEIRRIVPPTFHLPPRSGRGYFPIQATVEYQIDQPADLFAQRAVEIEARVLERLEVALRAECQNFALNQEDDLSVTLQHLARTLPTRISVEALRVIAVNLFLRRDDAGFRDMVRQEHTTSQYVYPDRVATRQTGFFFDVEVALTYEVIAPDQLPDPSPELTVQRFAALVRPILIECASRYNVVEAHEAQRDINRELERIDLEGFGLRVRHATASVKAEHDEAIRLRESTIRITQRHDDLALDELEGLLEEQRHERRLKLLQQRIDIYVPHLPPGASRLFAIRLAEDPTAIGEVLQAVIADEQQIRIIKANLFREMLNDDRMTNDQRDRLQRQIAEDTARSLGAPQLEVKEQPFSSTAGTTSATDAMEVTPPGATTQEAGTSVGADPPRTSPQGSATLAPAEGTKDASQEEVLIMPEDAPAQPGASASSGSTDAQPATDPADEHA